MEQGSEEWRAARLGKVTGSRIHDVLAKVKSGGFSASRARYAAELVLERLTDKPQERDLSYLPSIQQGKERERTARYAYELRHNVDVDTESAFVPHPTIEMAGCSPDGLVGLDGMVEIKAPDDHTHLDTLLGKSIDGTHFKQIQWNLACTGREWCDYISWNPNFPAEMQLHVQTVERDQSMINATNLEVVEFLRVVEAKRADLERIYRNG